MTLTTYPFSCWLSHRFGIPPRRNLYFSTMARANLLCHFGAVVDDCGFLTHPPPHPSLSHSLSLPFSLPLLPSPSLPLYQCWLSTPVVLSKLCSRGTFLWQIQGHNPTGQENTACADTRHKHHLETPCLGSDIWLIWALSPGRRNKGSKGLNTEIHSVLTNPRMH